MSRAARRLVVCLRNDGYAASLEKRKIYVCIADESAAKHGLTRVVDESGEDYLYPEDLFVAIELSPALRRAVMEAA